MVAGGAGGGRSGLRAVEDQDGADGGGVDAAGAGAAQQDGVVGGAVEEGGKVLAPDAAFGFGGGAFGGEDEADDGGAGLQGAHGVGVEGLVAAGDDAAGVLVGDDDGGQRPVAVGGVAQPGGAVGGAGEAGGGRAGVGGQGGGEGLRGGLGGPRGQGGVVGVEDGDAGAEGVAERVGDGVEAGAAEDDVGEPLVEGDGAAVGLGAAAQFGGGALVAVEEFGVVQGEGGVCGERGEQRRLVVGPGAGDALGDEEDADGLLADAERDAEDAAELFARRRGVDGGGVGEVVVVEVVGAPVGLSGTDDEAAEADATGEFDAAQGGADGAVDDFDAQGRVVLGEHDVREVGAEQAAGLGGDLVEDVLGCVQGGEAAGQVVEDGGLGGLPGAGLQEGVDVQGAPCLGLDGRVGLGLLGRDEAVAALLQGGERGAFGEQLQPGAGGGVRRGGAGGVRHGGPFRGRGGCPAGRAVCPGWRAGHGWCWGGPYAAVGRAAGIRGVRRSGGGRRARRGSSRCGRPPHGRRRGRGRGRRPRRRRRVSRGGGPGGGAS
ncbi:hypothetical protein GA0115250_114713 [Streptomyces sp. BvitLS-983]|nr:hypothetical protein GA0115250_114713 [Streptomyces sp. BvitLS-983]